MHITAVIQAENDSADSTLLTQMQLKICA